MTALDTLIKMNTTRNVGPWDRVVRAVLPALIGGLWYAGVLPAVVAVPVGLVSLMLLPTAFTGACSIYYVLGASTCPNRAGTVDPAPKDRS